MASKDSRESRIVAFGSGGEYRSLDGLNDSHKGLEDRSSLYTPLEPRRKSYVFDMFFCLL